MTYPSAGWSPAIQKLHRILSHHVENLLLVHHAAPENDLLRRVSQHVICHSLSDVVTFQFPDILSSGQFSSLSAIPALNRRTGSQSFQTGTVISTAAFIGILRVPAQEDMSALGMHQAMQQSAVNICPYTYSRTNGDIERILTLLATPNVASPKAAPLTSVSKPTGTFSASRNAPAKS